MLPRTCSAAAWHLGHSDLGAEIVAVAADTLLEFASKAGLRII